MLKYNMSYVDHVLLGVEVVEVDPEREEGVRTEEPLHVANPLRRVEPANIDAARANWWISCQPTELQT